jgi:hypothetical protein
LIADVKGYAAESRAKRGVEELSSPLVGRDKELGALREAVDNLKRGTGGIVTLVGEAGIDKSRLVAKIRGGSTLRTIPAVGRGPLSDRRARLAAWHGSCFSAPRMGR